MKAKAKHLNWGKSADRAECNVNTYTFYIHLHLHYMCIFYVPWSRGRIISNLIRHHIYANAND